MARVMIDTVHVLLMMMMIIMVSHIKSYNEKETRIIPVSVSVQVKTANTGREMENDQVFK